MDDATKKKEKHGFAMKMLPMMLTVPRIVGFLIVFAIFKTNETLFQGRMDKMIESLGSHIGYIYLSLGLFSVMGQLLNFLPMYWKSQVMPGSAGNLRSNMMIYKMLEPEGGKERPRVVLDDEGEVGEYNRANRALNHYVENALPVVLNIVFGGLVFGEAVFSITALYVVSRVWYQIAYATGGYGMGCCKHAVPFMIHGMIVPPILEMIVWVCGFNILQTHLSS